MHTSHHHVVLGLPSWRTDTVRCATPDEKLRASRTAAYAHEHPVGKLQLAFTSERLCYKRLTVRLSRGFLLHRLTAALPIQCPFSHGFHCLLEHILMYIRVNPVPLLTQHAPVWFLQQAYNEARKHIPGYPTVSFPRCLPPHAYCGLANPIPRLSCFNVSLPT